ncbi:MAG TPA: ShlB/FhaC/HecB family hemolysin secretion/activation protein [Azonexus sp.]
MLREVERPVTLPPHPAPILQLPAEKESPADHRMRFVVREVRLDGGEALDTASIAAELSALAGTEVSLADLRREASRLTQILREAGYALARVVVPAQEIRDGTVRFLVLEGRLGRISTDNRSALEDAHLAALLHAQVPADAPLQTAQLDRALQLLSDLSGAGMVTGTLAPGDRVGTSDLAVAVLPGKALAGEISIDDHGNHYTGRNRLNAWLDANSPAGWGERLRVSLTATDESLYYGRIAYDLPMGADGLRLGAAVSRSVYELGRGFAELKAHGTADTASIYGSYPLLRSRSSNLVLGGSVEQRQLADRVDATDSATDKSATVLTISLEGDWQDGFAGGAVSHVRLAASSGHLEIDTPAARILDDAGPQSAGGYAKWQASLSRLQAIGATTRLYAGLQGQWAGKNLDSSEKFTLGGAYGVRAYPQGEGVGDEGALVTLELRQDLGSGLEAKGFYDWGSVRINKNDFSTAANSLTLAGYGLGLGWRRGGFFLSAAIAWRDRQAAVSAPDKSVRTWLQLGWTF